VQSVEPRRLDRLDAEVRTELARVFPSLAGIDPGGAPGLADERYRINRAVRELLEQLAATKPLVLILDDFHWADSASVDLVASLLHRPPDAAVLVVIAARPNQGPARLVSALERALRQRELARIELEPLTGPEAAEMLGQEATNPRAAALIEESGGNPFYLEQLARSPEQAEWLAAEPDVALAGLRVPPMVASALTEELALLGSGSRRVLEGAAVAGDPFEPELAAAAAGLSEQESIEAIDELLGRDLLRPTTVPRRFRFRHPIVRRAVYEAAPAAWRIGAHERVAVLLAGRGAAAETRAHHVDRSARVGDLAAVATLAEAGRLAAPRAPAAAIRWFEGALRLLPDATPPGERVELLLASAGSLAAVGRFAEAREALIESLAIVPDESSSLRLTLLATCARVEHLLGRHEEAHARLKGALEGLSDATGPDAASLMIELAGDAMFHLEYGAAQDWAARAVAVAGGLGSKPLAAAALGIHARALAWGGEVGLGEEVRSSCAAVVDALSDEELAVRLDAVVNLGGSEIYLDRFEEAAAHMQRALEVGRATGQTQLFPGVYATLGVAGTALGRLAEAAELLDTATEAARMAGNPQALAWILFCRAFVAIAAGDNQTALLTAKESLDLAADAGQLIIAARSAAVLAVALLDDGQPAQATKTLDAFGGQQLDRIPDFWRAYLLELMTRCWLTLGRPEEARRTAAGAQDSADAVGLRLPAAMALRAAALVALDAQDGASAAEQAFASADLAESVGALVEAAQSRAVAGRAFAQLGDHERAIGLLEQAAATLEGCGALRYRDAAQQELRQLGRRIHRRSRPGDRDQTGVASLTERELQIAQLIVDRKTNGEIAGELFLSKKTVESHIRNMFRKLDASSRVDIARAVEEAERAVSR